jgi:hypothetical protein
MQQRILRFKVAESSMFASFDGTWMLKFHSRSRKFDSITGQYMSFYKTLLTYTVFIKPKGMVPVIALEWRIREDIPPNLKGLKIASENLFLSRQLFQDPSSTTATSSTATTTSSSTDERSINNNLSSLEQRNNKNDNLLLLLQSQQMSSGWGEDETLGKGQTYI